MGDTDIILAHLAVILAMVNKQLTKIKLMMPLGVSDKYFSDCTVLQFGVCGHVTFVTSVNSYYQEKSYHCEIRINLENPKMFSCNQTFTRTFSRFGKIGKYLHTYLIEAVQQRTSMCVSLSDREKKGGKGNEMS